MKTRYENHQIPDNINVPETGHVKEFLTLSLGLSAIIALGVVLISLVAEHVAEKIPFATEQKIAAYLLDQMADHRAADNTPTTEAAQAKQQRIKAYLERLAATLARHQQLPEGVSVTIHYVQAPLVNAFATLGGHVFIYQGLLEKMPDENALAMVVAHEIAHIKYRDPIASLGRGLTVAIALTALLGSTESGLAQQILGQVGTLTALNFTRDQERRADTEALHTLHSVYGHVDGAEALFEVLAEAHQGTEQPELFNTHPMTQDRIDAILQYKQAMHGLGKAPAADKNHVLDELHAIDKQHQPRERVPLPEF